MAKMATAISRFGRFHTKFQNLRHTKFQILRFARSNPAFEGPENVAATSLVPNELA